VPHDGHVRLKHREQYDIKNYQNKVVTDDSFTFLLQAGTV